MNTNLLKKIPAVHEIIGREDTKEIANKFSLSNEMLTICIREQLDNYRKTVLNGNCSTDLSTASGIEEFLAGFESALSSKFDNKLKRVLNATGTVLHTNLGRSRLSEKALERVVEVAGSYSTLEYNLETEKRGSRHDIIEDLIIELTGAESAIVVNNNAAAVFLILKAFSVGTEVIVSRGELVEIGGGFRVSSIMEESGAILREIGTTNKTRLSDYANAINENTSMIMKVHTSNFVIQGFTESVPGRDLFKLASEKNLLSYEDLGSGSIFDFCKNGIGDEPLVRDVINYGADIVSFSGDKLLGGPQAGVIIGKKKYIDILKKNQLTRMLRVDKMTLAALEATLTEYLAGSNTIPTVRDITDSKETVKEKCEKFISLISYQVETTLVEDFSTIGGGSLPTVEIETYCVGLHIRDLSPNVISTKCHQSTPALIGKIKNDTFWLDFRTISEKEIEEVANIVLSI